METSTIYSLIRSVKSLSCKGKSFNDLLAEKLQQTTCTDSYELLIIPKDCSMNLWSRAASVFLHCPRVVWRRNCTLNRSRRKTLILIINNAKLHTCTLRVGGGDPLFINKAKSDQLVVACCMCV